ncbi:hypothetical protein CLF_105107, partial [Clonorchis sinensis]
DSFRTITDDNQTIPKSTPTLIRTLSRSDHVIKTEQIPQTLTIHSNIAHPSMHCKLTALITVVLSTTLTTNGDGISCYESIGCVVEGINLNIFEREGCGACSKQLTHLNGGTCKMLGCEKTCEKGSAVGDLANAAGAVSKLLGEKLTIQEEKTCCYDNFCNSAIRRSQGAMLLCCQHFGQHSGSLTRMKSLVNPMSTYMKKICRHEIHPEVVSVVKIRQGMPTGTSEILRRILNTVNIRVGFQRGNTLRSALVKLKDRLPANRTRDCVYKIECNDCIKIYIGQTARELHTRIGEHKREINRPPRNAYEYRALLKDSAIAEHALDTGYRIDLENVEVLRRGLRSTSQRLMAEAVGIARHSSVNRIEGVELASLWRTVLDQSS